MAQYVDVHVGACALTA